MTWDKGENMSVILNKCLKQKKSVSKGWLFLPIWRDQWESMGFKIFLCDLGKGMMATKFIDTMFFKEVGTIIQYESL